MVEIISSILEAEKQSDEIIKKAEEQARSMLLNADVEADKIKNQAIDCFKAKKMLAVKKAEKEASELYEQIVADGKEEGELLRQQVLPKTDDVAKDLLANILK